ncbi:MAG: hypothetical protein ACTSQE_16260 [Candidatus Heimdallarchaeaceae archaeon]
MKKPKKKNTIIIHKTLTKNACIIRNKARQFQNKNDISAVVDALCLWIELIGTPDDTEIGSPETALHLKARHEDILTALDTLTKLGLARKEGEVYEIITPFV